MVGICNTGMGNLPGRVSRGHLTAVRHTWTFFSSARTMLVSGSELSMVSMQASDAAVSAKLGGRGGEQAVSDDLPGGDTSQAGGGRG